MSDLMEIVEAERVERAIQPRAQRLAAAKKNFRFPTRRNQRVLTQVEIDANKVLIADFIATKGVTVCPPGYAAGAVPTSYDFI